MYNGNKLNKRFFYLFFVFFIVLQLYICFTIGGNRKYLFTDEVYSYGLANSEYYTFIDPGTTNALIDNWASKQFFKDYLIYNKNVPFSFDAPFRNQANDVHPPVYYCLLHMVCIFFTDYAYSPLPGLTLNVIILILIDFSFYYVAKFFLKSKWQALFTTFFWSLSAAGLSNIILIRMYLLQTLEIILFVAFHIYMITHKKRITIGYFITLLLLVAFSGLSHYYFYFFAAALGGLNCLYMLLNKNYKNMFLYGLSLILGVLSALLVFPATINHIFGYRGEYATDNLSHFDAEKFSNYIQKIDYSILGGYGRIIISAAFIFIIIQFICKLIKLNTDNQLNCKEIKNQLILSLSLKKNSYNNILFLFSLLANAFFAYIAIQGSEMISTRYIYPAFPIFSIALIFIISDVVLFFMKKYKEILILLFCIFIDISSIHAYGIDWLYSDYTVINTNVEELYNNDVLIICRNDRWINVLSGINLYVNMEEVRCIYENNLENLPQILSERLYPENKLYIAFYSDAGYTDDEKNAILNKILSLSSYSSYEKVYDYYTFLYELKY